MTGPAIVAVDVGGTSIKAALVDEASRLLHRASVATPVVDGPDGVVAAIRDLVAQLTASPLSAAAVVVPGIVDAEAGVVRYAANLGWRDVPLRALLQDVLEIPVALGHDVRAAGRAEVVLGAARDVQDCLVVVVGTGIAAAVVIGGTVVTGSAGMAGEIGHTVTQPGGDACACGQRGCVETYASAAAIARRYAQRTGRPRTAQEIAGSLSTDPVAAAVWAEAVAALAAALADATALLDPALIVLGGGLAEAGEALRAPVRDALRSRLTWRPAPALAISPLGGSAGLHGAALLAWEAARRHP